MSISDGTILKIVVSLLLPDTVIAQNVFYSVVADLVTSDDEDDVVTDLVTYVEDMYDQLTGIISDTVVASDIKVYEYDSNDDDWDEVGTDTWADIFASGSDMMPHGVACLIHARSTDPDTHASKYIPGLSDNNALDSDITGAAVVVLADFADVWVAPFIGTETGGTFGPGVWSEADTVFKIFNGNYTVNGLVAYQRRRKPGVGI
jgi:hypothetical protein